MAHELDSFYFKFKNLLHSEKDAVLNLKSESGRCHVTLSVDLGHVISQPGHQPHHHRNGPARKRRRERRAEARRQAVVEVAKPAEEAGDALATEAIEVSEEELLSTTGKAVHESEKATENSEPVRVVDEICSDNEYKDKLAKPDGTKDMTEKITAVEVDKTLFINPVQSCVADSDSDVYHYKVFDESKKIEAQEVLDTMENRIRNNFIRFKVEKKDQVYKLSEIIHVEAEEELEVAEGFEVKMKVKKDALRLEHAMRNIQTSEGPLRINLRQILR